MENKPSMSRVERLHREKVTRYSIRKYSFGAASVAVAALFMFLGNGAVSADMTAVQPQDESGLKAERPDENAELPQVEKEIAQPAESTPAAQPIAEEPTAKPAEPATPALDKTKLESYIKEIEAKLANGSYANKTDESVAVLKADLEAAKTTLANATSQDELTKAYNKLVTTANTKLKNKPVEKKETPAVDTTNGKETVGKQAENTEKKSDSNSIENTGSNDPRNGKAMDKENALRTETTKSVGNISYTLEFSDDAKKEIYLYNEEDANVNITVNSTDGAIRNAFIKAAGNVYLDPDKKAKKLPSGNETKEEVDGFGWTYHQILSDTPSPATVSVTGKPNDTFKRLAAYTKKEDQHAVLGDRYLQVQDAAGGSITAGGNSGSAGYFKLVVKSQTYKYNIQEPAENGNKIGVTDIDNLTATDIQKIKDQIKIEYSKTSTDARLESKKGQLVDNQNSIVKRIDVDTTSKKVVVTYTDDSTDETPLSNIARTNEKPTVEIEYSDSAADKKEVYVYASEVNTFDIKIKDDSGKIASAELKRGSNQDFKDVAGETNKQDTQYGFTANKFTSETTATAENPAVITYTGTPAPEGTFTETKLKEVTRGENPPGIALGWRFVKAIDKDGADARGNGRDATDPTAVNVVLKPQTLKYDIKEVAQADKLPVADASNVTEAEFNEIKKRVEIQYSKTNPDKRLESKRGEVLTNRDERVDTIERNGNNLVVTYKDGSTDTKPLTDFARTNPAPTVSIPYSVDGKKDVYVYANEDIDIDIKFNDDSGKVKSATLLQGGSRTLPPVDASNPNVINNEFNTTFTKIDSETATPASIKITGKLTKETPGLDASKFPTDEKGEYPISTRYATATDTDDASIVNVANGSSYNTDPGGFRVVLKAQAKKYDIVTPTEEEKVAVANPEAVTDEEFAKIKAKLEYSRTNEDKNLESKRGEAVDNTDNKIATITKDGNNIVATYTDGSKDTRPLSDFTKLDKQPAIDAVNTAATEKIAAIKATPNATDEEKQAAIDKVTADQTKALAAINDANVTTKTALDAAQKAGTDAIAADNPVVAKKDAAKADVEAARKAKEDAIKANPNLSEDEKTAAIAKVNKAAEDAKKAIDAATSNADVETAKNTGISEFGKVNPVAKAAAKKAIADELSAKNTEIDGRQDLSQAEKDAAKAEAKKLADAQLDEIAKQPDNAETADAATAAQTAVNNAGTKGVADVKAVNPLGKTAAKADIETARQNKVDEITNNSNLSDEEKDAAIAKVNKAAEDAAKAIDAAQTADELTTAKGTGTTAIDNVTPVAKTAAKKAIADALTAKNAELDKRTDLTDEEKTAAKAEAQKLANAQLAEIAKQPDAADTKEAAKTAQDAVNAAGTKGAADVAAVNPAAKAKESAKADVEAARKAKEDAIKKDPNLSDKEKDAAIAKVNKAAEDAKKAIDAATSNADVETAKGTATTELGKVNPIAKENAKVAIANALTAKNAELDKRTDLTTEEKDAAKAEAKKLADAELAKIDAQPDNADTPEAAATAQKIVDDAEDKGVADVTAVNPEAKSKPAAKKAIEDKLAKQLEDIANTPDATDDEKKVAADAAKALADEAKEEIDKAGTDAEVKQLQKEAEGEIEKSVPVVEDKPNARKAIEEEAKAKKEAIDARNDLTPKAKEALKAKVDKVAEKAKEAIDAVTSVEDVNTIEESDKAAIKSIGDINRPIDKVLVKDPSALTDEEKSKILEEVKKVNPTAKEVKYNENGDIEVTTENGNKGTIKPAKLVKTEGDLDNGKGGNDIHKPLDKVIVKDPSALTDEEKSKIVAKVEEVNPDAIVTIDENGTVSVSTPDGKTAAIPASDLVRTKEDTAKAGAGNSNIVKPADKVVGEANDPDDQAKVEAKLRELNPETKSVKFDENGNATVTLNDGTTATIPSEDLFRSEADATTPNAGNDIVTPADKTVVANPAKLTDAEKKAIEDKVKAVNPDATVVVDDKGNATVTTPEGKTAVIPASDLTKSAADAAKPNAGDDIVKPADKTVVANPDALTPEEKKAIEDKVKAVNPGSTVVVDDKGNATVTTPEGKTAVIPASDLTKSAADVAKPNAGDDIVKPADKTVVANPDKLTDAEKKAIEDKVKAVNPGSTVVVDDKGNATVTTPEGKTAVIPASDLTKSEADAAKPNAGNDIVKPADKTVVANPDKLTDAEKKAIEDKVKAVNPGSTVVVDDKGNATVTTPEGKTAVIPASDLTKSAADAAKPNAGNDIVKPADKTVVANPDKLTDAEKKAIEDKVKAVNPGSTVVVDDKGNATVTTPEGKTAVIPASDLTKSAADVAKPNAGDDIVKPADKTVVANPDKLTDAEKKAIEDKVKAVNPGSTVVVDDKGNATVTTPEGKTAVIPASDLTKSEADAAKPNAGDDIVKPADKTVVANPDKLTDAEKKAIEDKVKAVNPGSTVVVDDKGNATVTTPEGKTAVIPASDLTKSAADAAKPNAGNDIVKPADKTVVANPDKLTDAEKKAIEDKVKAVNPGSTVVVDDKGNATVTTPEGKTAVIPASDLTKSAADAAKPNAGDDIVKPADKTVVANPDKLTDAEKKAIEDKVKAVNPGSTVVVDDKGNATVTTPAGKTAVIPASDLTKSATDAAKPNAGDDIVKPADKTVVANPDKLTDAEKKAIEDKVKAVNPGSTVVVDDKGNATVTTPAGKTAVIPATDLVKSPEDATKPNAGNDIVKPADKTVVANPDKLTDAEKKAIEDKVKAVNPGATVVVDDKGNATVTTPAGKTAVIPATDLTKSEADVAKPNAGNDIVKPADKTVVANPDKLTDAEKKAIEDKVKAVNPGSIVVVDDKGNATVTTPAGKTAVIPASDLTKSEADAAKPNAGNDIVKPADKTVVANPDALTPEEKKAIEDKVKAVNPDSTVVVDDKGNATVTTPAGKTAVIPATDLTKSAADAAKPNAGNDIVKPAAKTVVANPDALTSEEKKAIEDKVKAVNPGSTVVVDDKGNATVTTPEGKTAVIPASDLTKSEADAAKPNAGNDVNTPAAKTVVANPDKLTDTEKKAIEDKVKAVNPGATVVVDDKGNATVTTPEGKTAVIPATDLVKTQDDITKENAGNDVNTPAAKTVVANPDALTSEEKKAIEDKVKAVNPGSTVVVDDKGNATVAKGDGTVLNIPALDLVIPADDLADAAKNTAVKTPAIRTLVADKEKLTDAEKAAVKKAIEAVNPGATVVVDDKGNATVTLDGNTVSIAKDQLVKTASDVTAKNSGDNINLDFEKETVADLNNLTDAEKEAAKAKIKGANADVVEVIFDKAGNATVVTKDGKVLAIAAEDIFKQRPSAPNNGGNGTSGNNGTTNTDVKVDKAKLEGAIRQLDELIIKESAKLDAETAKEANALSADAKKVFANADASQAEVDAMVKRIEDFMAKVAPSTDHATPANDQAAQTPAVASATTQAAANASQTASAQANTRTVAKELPNTGTADSVVSMVAAAASALLGLGLAGRRRKEDEEA